MVTLGRGVLEVCGLVESGEEGIATPCFSYRLLRARFGVGAHMYLRRSKLCSANVECRDVCVGVDRVVVDGSRDVDNAREASVDVWSNFGQARLYRLKFADRNPLQSCRSVKRTMIDCGGSENVSNVVATARLCLSKGCGTYIDTCTKAFSNKN